MTKTKKILTAAVAVLLIAAAIFFAIWGRVAKRFDYSDLNYSDYVTLNGSLIGLNLDAVDDTALKSPVADDVLAKLADALYSYREKEIGSDGKETSNYKQFTDTEIGRFDAVYINYLGYYMDGANKVYFVDGVKMDKATLSMVITGGGSKHDGALKYIADALLGKKPADSKYALIVPTGTEEVAKVPAGAIVYIDYTWERFTVNGTEKTPAGNSGDDKTLVTKDVRVDLSNVSSIFPAGFGDKLVGLEIDDKGANSLTFEGVEVTETVDGQPVTNTYTYEYTVTVNFAHTANAEGWNPFVIDGYVYPADSEEKDIYGNSLAGKEVVFEVVASYYHNVPDLTAEYTTDSSHSHEEGEECDHMESILTHDKYLNFDNNTYFDDNGLLEKKDWDEAKTYATYTEYRDALVAELKLFIEESWNGQTEKKHETYVEYLQDNGVLNEADWTVAIACETYVDYLAPKYEAYLMDQLVKEYNDDRMYLAAKVIWENHIVPNTTIVCPERALKLAYEELLDQYEYSYNEGVDSETGVIYREAFKNVGEYIESAAKDDMKEYDVSDWKSYLKAVAEENVSQTILLYYLFELYEDELDYEASYNELYSQYLIYILYGYVSESQLRDAAKFDSVMTYLYEKANVTWKSDPTTGDTGSAD